MRGVQSSLVLELLQKLPRRRHRLGRRSGWHARRRQKYRRLAGTQSAGGWGLCLQPICTFQLAGYQLCDALVVLRDAVLAGLALSDGLHHFGTAGMAVGSASERWSVSANVRALSAAIDISRAIEVVLVDAHVADKSLSFDGILRHSRGVHKEPDPCGGTIAD